MDGHLVRRHKWREACGRSQNASYPPSTSTNANIGGTTGRNTKQPPCHCLLHVWYNGPAKNDSTDTSRVDLRKQGYRRRAEALSCLPIVLHAHVSCLLIHGYDHQHIPPWFAIVLHAALRPFLCAKSATILCYRNFGSASGFDATIKPSRSGSGRAPEYSVASNGHLCWCPAVRAIAIKIHPIIRLPSAVDTGMGHERRRLVHNLPISRM